MSSAANGIILFFNGQFNKKKMMGEHSNYLHTILSSLLAIEMDPSDN